jgi:hypothetical protein
MLIGHYAVGFTGRGALRDGRRRPSLGTWFLAVQWLDLIWPIFVLAHVERISLTPGPDPFLQIAFTYYPWTHSLLMTAAWAALFAGVYGWRTGDISSGRWLALGVLSHWGLDALVHVPDLPLYPGSAVKVGLGLWHSVGAAVALEGGLFAAAVVWYIRRTSAADATGRWALWTLVVLLAAIYTAGLVGPAPPSEGAVAASGLLLWLLVPWAYWIDRHRVDVTSGRAA